MAKDFKGLSLSRKSEANTDLRYIYIYMTFYRWDEHVALAKNTLKHDYCENHPTGTIGVALRDSLLACFSVLVWFAPVGLLKMIYLFGVQCSH